MLPGRGVRAVAAGREILRGNRELLEDSQVILTQAQKSQRKNFWPSDVRLFIRPIDGKAAGFLALSDTLRKESPEIIRQIRGHGHPSGIAYRGP